VGHPDRVDIFDGFDAQRFALTSGGFVHNSPTKTRPDH
jgi:hypothetical protein